MSKMVPATRPRGRSKTRVAHANPDANEPSSQAGGEATQRRALDPLDLSLVKLAGALEQLAQKARELAGAPSETPDIIARKGALLRRLSRTMLGTWGLKEETQAPYPQARMVFALSVINAARGLRLHGKFDAETLSRLGGGVALVMMDFYPAIANRFGGDRLERICKAIVAVASGGKTIPWKTIAGAWTGIEKGAQDNWRQEWRAFLRRVMGLSRTDDLPVLHWGAIAAPDFPFGARVDVERRLHAYGQARADVRDRKQKTNGPRGTPSSGDKEPRTRARVGAHGHALGRSSADRSGSDGAQQLSRAGANPRRGPRRRRTKGNAPR